MCVCVGIHPLIHPPIGEQTKRSFRHLLIHSIHLNTINKKTKYHGRLISEQNIPFLVSVLCLFYTTPEDHCSLIQIQKTTTHSCHQTLYPVKYTFYFTNLYPILSPFSLNLHLNYGYYKTYLFFTLSFSSASRVVKFFF